MTSKCLTGTAGESLGVPRAPPPAVLSAVADPLIRCFDSQRQECGSTSALVDNSLLFSLLARSLFPVFFFFLVGLSLIDIEKVL